MPGRGRAVGLSRPRAAPAGGNAGENFELSNSEDEIPGADQSESEHQRGARGAANREEIVRLEESGAAAPAPVVARRAARPRVRGALAGGNAANSRPTWRGNHAKLNIVFRTLLQLPAILESSAIHANDQDAIVIINSHKRNINSDFGWDNVKHAGQTFLMHMATRELNDDPAFAQYLVPGIPLKHELLRQKFNEFMDEVAEDTADYSRPDIQQWKLDSRDIDTLQKSQQEIVANERREGVQERGFIEENIGNLVRAAGVENQRDISVRALRARVSTESGRIIARQRESGVIPQQVQRPANHPGIVAPELVIANVARGQHNLADDPVIQALLHVTQAAQPQAATVGPVHPVTTAKTIAEVRDIEITTQMRQYEFAKEHMPEGQNKEQVLESIRRQILGCPEIKCCICQSEMAATALNVARTSCCGAYMHLICAFSIRNEGFGLASEKKCPLCRQMMQFEEQL
jgi:hypothetical protein